MSQKKVSVIVPVYNVEKYIKKCVESLINQEYRNFEIILINDGSVDNSGMIIDEMSLRDDRIKVIHQKNQGVSAARNVGISFSKGEYITFVDGDDWVDKDYISYFAASQSYICKYYIIEKKKYSRIAEYFFFYHYFTLTVTYFTAF